MLFRAETICQVSLLKSLFFNKWMYRKDKQNPITILIIIQDALIFKLYNLAASNTK